MFSFFKFLKVSFSCFAEDSAVVTAALSIYLLASLRERKVLQMINLSDSPKSDVQNDEDLTAADYLESQRVFIQCCDASVTLSPCH